MKCNPLNRSAPQILAHGLLLSDREGTDFARPRVAASPGEAHGHVLARNFSVLGERSIACSRPRKCRSILEARFVCFAGACPRGTCRAGKRGAQHRLSWRGSCSSLTPIYRVRPIRPDRSQHRLPLARPTPPGGFFLAANREAFASAQTATGALIAGWNR